MLEDYTNRVYDLLSHTPANQTKAQLPVSMVNDGILSVKNLTVLFLFRISNAQKVKIVDAQQGLDVINQGIREKHVAETRLNLNSSRSHMMCTIDLVRTEEDKEEVIATCRIVDLAGSERAARTGADGERMKEAGQINNDLTYLMTVLEKMNQGKQAELYNFRVCKLTMLLSVCLERDYYYYYYYDDDDENENNDGQTSIIGNLAGPVSMMINISNDREDYDETFYALEKTAFVKDIKTVQKRYDLRDD